MSYEEFASDLPPHRTLAFHSVEEQEEALRSAGVEQPMRQLGSGPYRSHLAFLETEDVGVFADRYNTALTMQLRPPPGNVGILFPRSVSGRFLISGENMGVEHLILFPDGASGDIVVPDLAGSEALSIPGARFIEMTEVLCPGFAPPEGVATVQGSAAHLNGLRMAVLDLLVHPELEPIHETVSNLLAASITAMGYSLGDRKPERLMINEARARVARFVRDVIEECYDETIRMEDLCRETGVGVRTLQRCFREYFDLTVTEYLKAVRLDAAQRDLNAATAGEDQVTEIALAHGFTHLGRFSVEYRKRFGELPRETLFTRNGQKTSVSGERGMVL